MLIFESSTATFWRRICCSKAFCVKLSLAVCISISLCCFLRAVCLCKILNCSLSLGNSFSWLRSCFVVSSLIFIIEPSLESTISLTEFSKDKKSDLLDKSSPDIASISFSVLRDLSNPSWKVAWFFIWSSWVFAIPPEPIIPLTTADSKALISELKFDLIFFWISSKATKISFRSLTSSFCLSRDLICFSAALTLSLSIFLPSSSASNISNLKLFLACAISFSSFTTAWPALSAVATPLSNSAKKLLTPSLALASFVVTWVVKESYSPSTSLIASWAPPKAKTISLPNLFSSPLSKSFLNSPAATPVVEAKRFKVSNPSLPNSIIYPFASSSIFKIAKAFLPSSPAFFDFSLYSSIFSFKPFKALAETTPSIGITCTPIALDCFFKKSAITGSRTVLFLISFKESLIISLDSSTILDTSSAESLRASKFKPVEKAVVTSPRVFENSLLFLFKLSNNSANLARGEKLNPVIWLNITKKVSIVVIKKKSLFKPDNNNLTAVPNILVAAVICLNAKE